MSDDMKYKAKKINKRMVIVQNDEIVYTMPDWIRIVSRKDIEELADKFNQANDRCIISIMEFETKFYKGD